MNDWYKYSLEEWQFLDNFKVGREVMFLDIKFIIIFFIQLILIQLILQYFSIVLEKVISCDNIIVILMFVCVRGYVGYILCLYEG